MKQSSFFSIHLCRILAIALLTGLAGCTTEGEEVAVYEVERSWPDYFLEHQQYFEPQTYKIEGAPIWSINNPENWATNSIVIEGDDALIVYDTGLSRENGEAVLAEILKISDKPIRTIFYSHHHTDHYNGTDALVSADADIFAEYIAVW